MVTRRMISFELDEDLIEALNELKERTGHTVSHQIREAIRAWVGERADTKGATKKTKTRK
jgi:predicted DNA-binding protein